jgi:hypothetical protein
MVSLKKQPVGQRHLEKDGEDEIEACRAEDADKADRQRLLPFDDDEPGQKEKKGGREEAEPSHGEGIKKHDSGGDRRPDPRAGGPEGLGLQVFAPAGEKVKKGGEGKEHRKPKREEPGAGMAKVSVPHPESLHRTAHACKEKDCRRDSFPTFHGAS